MLLLEVKPQIYVSYPAATALTDVIGATIASGQTYAVAKDACDKDASCVGLVTSAATDGSWRTIAGALFEDKQTKIKAYGVAIESSIAQA